MAVETKIVKLPFEHSASHGKDLRDFFNEGHTIEELLAIADATPALTLDDVSDELEKQKKKDPPIRNFERGFEVNEKNCETKEVLKPIPMLDVLMKIRKTTDDWPRQVEGSLFVNSGGQISFLPSPPAPFGYLQNKTGIIEWSRTSGAVSKEEVFHELQRTATGYIAIEPLPHHPQMPGHYYAGPQPESGDGQALEELLDRFKPETLLDRDLIKAALMTLFWGGDGGTRPVFVVTADEGRGKGKSKLGELLASVAGGVLDFSHNEEIAQIKTRLLSRDARCKRVAVSTT